MRDPDETTYYEEDDDGQGICMACGSNEFEIHHGKVYCLDCGALVENCCGD